MGSTSIWMDEAVPNRIPNSNSIQMEEIKSSIEKMRLKIRRQREIFSAAEHEKLTQKWICLYFCHCSLLCCIYLLCEGWTKQSIGVDLVILLNGWLCYVRKMDKAVYWS
eukprot:TRINITY_DN14387_c1_g1_i1.p1 TRINITY_DN14387_c1_g1~~TRINITY_DN14387_c1_g1_i1.p1  ORF type:complete len:109 (-),score=12.06 TRINITY_DN14387_c1_g1_i1:67-393(-)